LNLLSIGILAFTTFQRLGELWLSARNTRVLKAQGAYEAGAAHYPVMVLLHATWIVGLWWFARDRPVVWPWLVVFALCQVLRVWVIATLGDRWTTRIIVLPEAPLVNTGPFRLIPHPNYAVVAVEIAALPLAFGLVAYAVVFSLLNAAMLFVRIRAEDAALQQAKTLSSTPEAPSR
jgi:methyltransferase